MHICGVRFQEHCFNISWDIFIQYVAILGCKSYDVTTDLICIMEGCQYLWKEEGYFKGRRAILLCFEIPFKFHVIYTLRWGDVVGQILLASTIVKEGFHILLNLGIEQRFILLLVLPKYLFSKLVIKWRIDVVSYLTQTISWQNESVLLAWKLSL